MLNVERKIILNSNYINKNIYLGENIISEGLISFIKTGSNNTCYMGFMDSLGNEVIEAKYTDVSSFKNGLAWVYNDYFVPILINKNGEELLYSKCDLYAYKALDKQRDKYLNEHKSFAKKNKYIPKKDYKTYEKNGLYGLKDENGNIVIPANYKNFVYKDDILIVDDILYDINSLTVNYLLRLYDLDYGMQKEFDTYDKMEEYITLFKKEYDSKACLINEDILKKIFELQNEKKDSIKKLFIDADKKCGRLLKK